MGSDPASSLQVSPARTCPSPAQAPGSTDPEAVSGSRSSGSSPNSSAKTSRRTTSSLKTSLPFALADWIACSGGSLRSGMMRNGIVYPLPPLALATDGTASGSWPTAKATNATGASNTATRQGAADLQTAVTMRPTPRAEDGESTGMSAARLATRAPDNLPSAVRAWPTPAARVYRSPNAAPYSERGGGSKGGAASECGWRGSASDLGRGIDGISAWLDGSWEHGVPRVGTGIPDRRKRLIALGNSLVPQIAEIIGRAVAADFHRFV